MKTSREHRRTGVRRIVEDNINHCCTLSCEGTLCGVADLTFFLKLCGGRSVQLLIVRRSHIIAIFMSALNIGTLYLVYIYFIWKLILRSTISPFFCLLCFCLHLPLTQFILMNLAVIFDFTNKLDFNVFISRE